MSSVPGFAPKASAPPVGAEPPAEGGVLGPGLPREGELAEHEAVRLADYEPVAAVDPLHAGPPTFPVRERDQLASHGGDGVGVVALPVRHLGIDGVEQGRCVVAGHRAQEQALVAGGVALVVGGETHSP